MTVGVQPALRGAESGGVVGEMNRMAKLPGRRKRRPTSDYSCFISGMGGGKTAMGQECGNALLSSSYKKNHVITLF